MAALSGQVIIITGASSGIGEATARRLFTSGAKLVLAARRQDRLERLKEELQAKSEAPGQLRHENRVISVAGDINNAEQRKRLVRETIEAFGRIDGLINNAGFGQRGPVEIIPLEAIRQNFETNLFALIGLTQEVIPIMRQQQRGRIVNVGSVAGKIARPFSSVYDATKHALEAITDGLRGEMSLFGIDVILVEPGYILTEFLQTSNRISAPMLANSGPYEPFLSDFARLSERAKSIAGHPEQIAELISRALTEKRPRFRYAGPRHALVFLAMKRFLPERIFDYLALRQMGLKRS